MPRFAANLSFNPLEPLKPATAPGAASVSAKDAGSSEKSANCPPASKPAAPSSLSIALDPLQVATVGSASVPAAQFDWNSSVLVNPLEGKLSFGQIFCAAASLSADRLRCTVVRRLVNKDDSYGPLQLDFRLRKSAGLFVKK